MKNDGEQDSHISTVVLPEHLAQSWIEHFRQFACDESSDGIKYPFGQISLSFESELLFIAKIIIKIIIIIRTINPETIIYSV